MKTPAPDALYGGDPLSMNPPDHRSSSGSESFPNLDTNPGLSPVLEGEKKNKKDGANGVVIVDAGLKSLEHCTDLPRLN